MSDERRITRRGLFAAAGASAVAASVAAVSLGAEPSPSRVVPFYGRRQAGILTPPQDHLVFATFDVTGSREDLQGLLAAWGALAATLTAGRPVPSEWDATYPPSDTGETAGLDASSLTITVGYGPSLFDHRFGLAGKRPRALVDLPPLAGDAFEPQRTGGDLCIQACADDPVVAFHAVRNLALNGAGTVALRSLRTGSGRTSTTSRATTTERNLLGFKDGTNNLTADDTELLRRSVDVDPSDDQAWLGGGTYLVARRLRLDLEAWQSLPLDVQEDVIGRFRASGAPLTGTREHDVPDLARLDTHGNPIIPANAHIRIAAPSTNGGVHLLRRGYNFVDGVDATGAIEAGLFFICFQRNPVTGFAAIAADLARSDALMRYVTCTDSGVFACPPGLARGEQLGASLFA